MNNLTQICAELIIDQIPYRRAYSFFGSPRYQSKHVEPWMVISFAVGVHLAWSKMVQSSVREELGSQYQRNAVDQMLAKNPSSYSNAQTFPYEFFPFMKQDDSYTSTLPPFILSIIWSFRWTRLRGAGHHHLYEQWCLPVSAVGVASRYDRGPK